MIYKDARHFHFGNKAVVGYECVEFWFSSLYTNTRNLAQTSRSTANVNSRHNSNKTRYMLYLTVKRNKHSHKFSYNIATSVDKCRVHCYELRMQDEQNPTKSLHFKDEPATARSAVPYIGIDATRLDLSVSALDWLTWDLVLLASTPLTLAWDPVEFMNIVK